MQLKSQAKVRRHLLAFVLGKIHDSINIRQIYKERRKKQIV